MRILLVEDDELLGDGVRTGLEQFKYTVDWVKDGQAALLALSAEKFDAVVLDLGLPKRSGLDVLRTMREKGDKTPTLILTARETVEDRITGLDAGADDYMTKPFDLNELSARLRALTRRSVARATSTVSLGAITLDPASHSVTVDNVPIAISRREFTLLEKLLEQPGKVLSRDYLEQCLYGWSEEVDSNALQVHIHNLRKKFRDKINIRTIRGVGYSAEEI